MPFLYVYQANDFVGGLPAEQGAQAAGSPNFTLTLSNAAVPVQIDVTDNDTIFDEVDSTQSLTSGVTLNGTFYPAGTTINTAYDLINTGSGHRVTSFHLGGDGFQQGPVVGIVSTVPLTPGQSYVFNTERTSHQQNNSYDDYVACFANGTLIGTDTGKRPVEALTKGDRILTLDHGAERLRLRLSRTLSHADLIQNPNLRPVLIRKGSLGTGMPERDLRVSPQHRILAQSRIVERMFNVKSVLIAAKKLVGLPGIEIDHSCTTLSYHHLVFDRHELLRAEGLLSESFFLGPHAIRTIPPNALAELKALFPEVAHPGWSAPSVRPIPAPRQQTRLIARHHRNKKPIFTSPGPDAGTRPPL